MSDAARLIDTIAADMQEQGYSTAQGFNTKCARMGTGELPDENQVGSFSKTSISCHNARPVAVSSTDTLKTPVGGESSGLLNIGANETILDESGAGQRIGIECPIWVSSRERADHD